MNDLTPEERELKRQAFIEHHAEMSRRNWRAVYILLGLFFFGTLVSQCARNLFS